MRWAPLLMIIILAAPVLAAELHGSIYTTELELAQDILVEVDSTPHQRMLSTDGTYTFTLPPGTYEIIATYLEAGSAATSTESVIIAEEGDFVFDLFLLPDLDLDTDELVDEELLETLDEPTKTGDVLTRLLIVAAILGFLILAARIVTKKAMVDEQALEGDDTVQEVLNIIKAHGGRITQKNLRKELPLSEAKISLVVAELEANGQLKKIKKGRGNILVLRKV